MDTVRQTAKAILTVVESQTSERPDGKIIMVQGATSGRWNLPGGGVENGEQPQDACKRELAEELGSQVLKHLVLTRRSYRVCGVTTPMDESHAVYAKWHVFTGSVEAGTDLLQGGEEIGHVGVMYRGDALALPHLSKLAQKALLLDTIELHQQWLGLNVHQTRSELQLPLLSQQWRPVQR